MLISAAYAAAGTASTATTADTGAGQAFMLNVILIVIMIGLFYFMMIVPQQKRMRRHREMLSGLRKGDKIVTSGGLIGVVDKIKDGEDEVVVDFGNGVKIATMRSMVELRQEEKDNKKKDPKKDPKKDVK